MVVALRNKQPIANLISVDNAPVDAALKSDFAKYVQGMRKIEDSNLTKQSEADALLAEYEPSLPIRQFLLTNLQREKDGYQRFRIPVNYLAAALDNMADFPFKNPDEARWSGPTLFVRGTKSHYVADETLPIIGRFFPRFELVDIESGHWVISEKPQDFKNGNHVDMLSLVRTTLLIITIQLSSSSCRTRSKSGGNAYRFINKIPCLIHPNLVPSSPVSIFDRVTCECGCVRVSTSSSLGTTTAHSFLPYPTQAQPGEHRHR